MPVRSGPFPSLLPLRSSPWADSPCCSAAVDSGRTGLTTIFTTGAASTGRPGFFVPAEMDPKAGGGKEAFLGAGQIFVLILWLIAPFTLFSHFGPKAAMDNRE